MALKSVTVVKRGKWSNLRANVVDVVHSGAYVTGGETITAAKAGMDSISVFFANSIEDFDFAYSSGKMIAIRSATGKVVTGGQSVAGTTRCLIIGT